MTFYLLLPFLDKTKITYRRFYIFVCKVIKNHLPLHKKQKKQNQVIDKSLFDIKTVAFHTLGCKLNFAETSYIGRLLYKEGYRKAAKGEEADICIINTCSVTDTADHKCRQAISKIKRQHPYATIIVTGCYAQLKPTEIAAIEGVDFVLGNNEKFQIANILQQREQKVFHSNILKEKNFQPSFSNDDRTRYFLKIQDGCNYQCTYCTIPKARGRSRSTNIAQTLRMVDTIIKEGGQEIVLTGVNTGDFGIHQGETFFQLIKALDNIQSPIRFRISSIEPNLLSDDIIAYIATSKHFMPHFHIPLQSGSDEVLKLMKRRYDTQLFSDKIKTIKKFIPNAFIGIDTIVGVRGETEKLFEESQRFLQALDFAQLHVFTYSERADTQMLNISHSEDKKERKRRSDVLHQLSDKKLATFYQTQIEQPTEVLWEGVKRGGKMYGFSTNYIKAECDYDKTKINQVEKVILRDWNEEKTALTIN